VLQGDDLEFAPDHLGIPGFPQPVDLNLANPYEDMS